jgi:S-adenosylmethionine decarboxylase proenzyme
MSKLKLHGFNNLTKTLSFNIYDICYADLPAHRRKYIEYIDEAYNAERLTQILTDVADIIGATILNTARQDYDPQGASVTMLISEETLTSEQLSNSDRCRMPWSLTWIKAILRFIPILKVIRTRVSAPFVPISTYPPAGESPH